MSIFTYNMGDEVFFLYNHAIIAGKIIGRKFIDASEYKNAPEVRGKNYDHFMVAGNKLGAPCERYELKCDIVSGVSYVIDVSRIFPSKEMLIESLLLEKS